MKSFAADEKPIDIEELNKLKCINRGMCQSGHSFKKIHLIQDNTEWFVPNDMDTLYSLLKQYSSYKLLSGNTGVGVFKNEDPVQVIIDIKNIQELYAINKSANALTIGSQITLNNLIDILNQNSTSQGFEYLSEIAHHIRKIANTGVRNTGTWAGNLVMKHNHIEFPSDVFICFETVGSLVTLIGPGS